MAKRARSREESAIAARRGVDATADAPAPAAGGPLSTPAGEAHGTTAAGHQPRCGPRGRRDWAEAGGAGGMRAKATLGARAQAGAMLRLTRVMKNR